MVSKIRSRKADQAAKPGIATVHGHMSVAINWANKKQLAKCVYMVGFPISSHKYYTGHIEATENLKTSFSHILVLISHFCWLTREHETQNYLLFGHLFCRYLHVKRKSIEMTNNFEFHVLLLTNKNVKSVPVYGGSL